MPFQGGDQRGFFAADKRASPFDDLDVEFEPAAQNVFAKQAVFAGLFDGTVQVMHGQRVLGADINDALGGTHDVAADDHAFEQGVRIAFNLIAVHVGAGVAFVRVADDVLLVGLCLGEELPLVSREISGATATAQLRSLDLLNDVLGAAVDQDFVKSLITTDGDVFFDVIGIDEAAVAQNDFFLSLEEGDVTPETGFRDIRGHISPGR